jgi:hypothetical protein
VASRPTFKDLPVILTTGQNSNSKKKKAQLFDNQTTAPLNLCDLAGTRTQGHLIKSQVLYRLSYKIDALYFKSGAKIR